MLATSVVTKITTHLSRRSLAYQLVLLVAVTAIPLLLSSLLMFDKLTQYDRENLKQNLLGSARAAASLVDNEIDTHTAIATTLAQSPSLMRSDLPAFWQEAKNALAVVPGAWLAVSTPDGQMVLNTLTEPGATLPPHAAPGVISKAFETKRPQVGDMLRGPVAKRPVVFVEAPAFRDGVPLYSLSVGIPPERFLDLIKTQFTHGEVVAIVDRNKNFVARIPDHESRVGTQASQGWRAAMAKEATGWTDNKTLEGNDSLTGYVRSASGWTAGVAQLESEIQRPLRSILWTSALTAVFLTAVSALMALLIARHTSQGLKSLAVAAARLGEGELVQPVQTPFSEAATISAALIATSQELKRRGDIIAQDRLNLEQRVTERTAELAAEAQRRSEAEQQLRQAQKMEAVGQLTGGIAHDFNNMLAVVIGSLDMARRRSARGETNVGRFIDNALDGAQRAAALTHRLLAFSRQQPLMPAVTDANALVAGITDLLRRTVGETIQLETVLAGGLWRTTIDAGQLEQAIVNLAVNGRDAMPDGGRLTIETFNASLDDAYARAQPGLAAGQYVAIAVSDNGTGMEEDVAAQAFDPFFTTKEVGKGSGLGLSQIYGFVRQSGGHAKIYSETGHGTTVKLYLPRYTGSLPVAEAAPEVTTETPRGNPGELILVVEDEAKVRHMVVDALRDLGYTVRHASGGHQALDLADALEGVSLLLTDIVMPEMNGRALADAMVTKLPDIKVLYTTGYTRNAVIHDGKLDANVNFLAKPFTVAQLAAKVRNVLDART